MPNTYTGGTIIAGGKSVINDAGQLNAQEENIKGGPIVDPQRRASALHLPLQGSPDIFMAAPIMVNTDGTPDRMKNCGSVIEVDGGVTHPVVEFRFLLESLRLPGKRRLRHLGLRCLADGRRPIRRMPGD